MELKYFKNKSNKEYEIILSGEVGWDVIGKKIADEIRYLNSIGATKITERINSGGGYVVDGYDIVDANLNSSAIIETIVTGLAASTAGWLAATGTKGYRFIVDYGKGMIHDPSIGGNTIEDMPDGPDKEGLMSIKDSIATILSNNSNLKKDKINELMTKETWLSAEEWVSFGFADKVIKTSNKPVLKDSYSMLEFVNACSNIKQTNTINKMERVLNYLNLTKDASEASALAAVENIAKKAEIAEGKVENLNTEITGLKNQISEKDTTIAELQNKVKTFESNEIKNAVKSAIDSGKFSKDDEEKLTAQCEKLGVDHFNEMVEMVKLPRVNVLDNLENKGGKTTTTPDQKLAEEYQNLAENDPMKLEQIKNTDPARFEKMFEAWNK
jgi:ATP-dependent Clp protease protease subunit